METEEFKKGDKVYCVVYGKGEVVLVVDSDASSYPISVHFGDKQVTYTLCGRLFTNSNPTLSHTEKVIVDKTEVFPRWLRVFKEESHEWIEAYIIGLHNNCAVEVKIDNSVIFWANWKNAETLITLSVKEIEEKLGIRSGSLLIQQ